MTLQPFSKTILLQRNFLSRNDTDFTIAFNSKLLLATQPLHVTTCQGKNGNLELWYNIPHHTLAEFT